MDTLTQTASNEVITDSMLRRVERTPGADTTATPPWLELRVLSGSRSSLVDDAEALYSEPVDADGVFVVPGLGEKQHVKSSRTLKIDDATERLSDCFQQKLFWSYMFILYTLYMINFSV
jgi:hypothetical protein